MPFLPNRGSQDTLVSLSGMSLATTTGVYFESGATGALCTLLTTGNSLITFYPPVTPPSGIRSGVFRVYNEFGNAATTDYFTWINTPYISGIAPFSGFSGTYFKISGSGIRDITGLWFNDLYTGVLTDAVFEASTWIRSGIVPFISGGLNSYFTVKVMSEGGSSVSPRLFFVREMGGSLSGLSDFPTPIQAHNYLRGNSSADALEWRTPTQVLGDDLTGVRRNGGDYLTGNYYVTGGALHVTGLIIQSTGLLTGNAIFRSNIFSGNYLTLDAIVGGISWRCFSLKIS